MKTVVVDVGDLLSVQSALGVEKQVIRLPGVERAEVNVVSGSRRCGGRPRSVRDRRPVPGLPCPRGRRSAKIAALAMSGSSALVAVNAILLKRARLEGIGRTTAPGQATGVKTTALEESAGGVEHGAHASR